jgi:hypothetical protein
MSENNTTATVTEALTLTKVQREKLVTLFVESGNAKLKRVKGLLQYTKWTVDQVVAAMHVSADATGDLLVVPSSSKSTMKRAMAVAKAWVATGADALCVEGDDSRDAILTDLAQIADENVGQMAAYLVPEADRVDPKVREYRPVPVVVDGVEVLVDIDHGSGEKAIAGIVAEYVTTRAMSPETAAEWVRMYRVAVKWASNEKRRAAQDHDTIAAGARVGDGDGENARAPRIGNQGAEPTVERVQPEVPNHKLPADKTIREATTVELIVALTKRVVDYSVAMTPADAKAWDELTGHYQARFDNVRLGETVTTVVEQQEAARVEVQLAPAPMNQDALIRALLAELSAGNLAPEALTGALANA